VVKSKLPHPAFEFVRHFEFQVNEFGQVGLFQIAVSGRRCRRCAFLLGGFGGFAMLLYLM
jgi:hypothetical protein